MALEDYVSRKSIRSAKTAETYKSCIRLWAKFANAANPDELVSKIKSGQLDPYAALQSFITHLNDTKKAPKTILTYYAAAKGFLLSEDVELSENKLKNKITLPQFYTVSTDRAPTYDEMQRILDYARSSPPTRLAIMMLTTSGMRISELTSLRIRDIAELDRQEGPVLIKIKAQFTKTRTERRTFITQETAQLLREHLGDRISKPDERILPIDSDSLYTRIMRTMKKAELKTKTEPESKRYEIHPHSFRKYFFTNLLAAGIDRGIVEGFMGHKFGLDSAYLRMSDDQLRELYAKAHESMSFLGEADSSLRSRIEKLEDENRALRGQVEKWNQWLEGMVSGVQEKWEKVPRKTREKILAEARRQERLKAHASP
jgi:integrase